MYNQYPNAAARRDAILKKEILEEVALGEIGEASALNAGIMSIEDKVLLDTLNGHNHSINEVSGRGDDAPNLNDLELVNHFNIFSYKNTAIGKPYVIGGTGINIPCEKIDHSFQIASCQAGRVAVRLFGSEGVTGSQWRYLYTGEDKGSQAALEARILLLEQKVALIESKE